MSHETNNVALTEHLAEELMKGNLDVVNEVFAPDFIDHDPAPDQGEGAEGLRDFWQSFRTAFPDFQIKVEQMVVQGDKVAIAYTVSGTNQGEFETHEPTDKRMSVRGLQIARFEDGQIAERWGMTDLLEIHKQLGLVPANV